MKRSILSILLLLPTLAIAQSNFQKGYVVTNSKDTLYGYVDYKASIRTPSGIRFRSADNAAVQIYTTDDCTAYAINGQANYRRYKVNISLAPTETNSLRVGIDTSFHTQEVFLKELQKGRKLSLFSYTDQVKEHFYILDEGSAEPVELIMLKYLEAGNSSRILSRERYKNQLFSRIQKYNPGNLKIEEKLKSATYSEEDFLEVIGLINGQDVKPVNRQRRFFVGAGASSIKASYVGTHPLARNSSVSKTSIMPSFSVGVDLFSGSTSERWVYRAELDLFMGEQSVKNGDNIHTFDHRAVFLSPKLICNLYNTDNLKGYLGLGAAISYASYSNSKSGRIISISGFPASFEESKIDFSTVGFSYNLNAGIVIRKRVELSLNYTPPYSIIKYAGFKAHMQILNAGLKYLFI